MQSEPEVEYVAEGEFEESDLSDVEVSTTRISYWGGGTYSTD